MTSWDSLSFVDELWWLPKGGRSNCVFRDLSSPHWKAINHWVGWRCGGKPRMNLLCDKSKQKCTYQQSLSLLVMLQWVRNNWLDLCCFCLRRRAGHAAVRRMLFLVINSTTGDLTINPSVGGGWTLSNKCYMLITEIIFSTRSRKVVMLLQCW